MSLRLLALLLAVFCAPASSANFALKTAAGMPAVLADDTPTMHLAANLLRKDLQAVGGTASAQVQRLEDCPQVCIVIGRYDSPLLRDLAQREGLDFAALSGGWERYLRIGIESRTRPGTRLLVIAGADTRGAIYGAVDLTRELGVSAWEWWADVVPTVRDSVSVDGARLLSESPSVRYRGIFLNDEDWGLQPWAARHDPVGDIGPATYARIFELMWRLKANLIWPAMHDVTKPFYQVPGNAQAADDYAIVVGTSHAEPMMRNNVREWDAQQNGPFNFFTNRAALVRYWQERVEAVHGHDNMYSMGIRGVHDSAMEGAATIDAARDGVAAAIGVQRAVLATAHGKPVAQIPQALTVCKEVLDIYNSGLQVPDDITLVWPDDNYGYLHQLGTAQEAGRGGGMGLYYHLSYWGRPHDYLWLATTHPGLVREQLQRAVATHTQQAWVANVGDIKPGEYLTQYFLDLAFDNRLLERTARQHLVAWMGSQFGAAQGAAIADIMLEYYALAWERRPEFMGFSQTEPTTPTRQTDYLLSGGDEAERRLARYAALVQRAQAAGAALPADRQDAYFQLVLYPVRGAANLNARILKFDLAALHARQGRPSAQQYAQEAQAAQEAIAADTALQRTGRRQVARHDGCGAAPPARICGTRVPDVRDAAIVRTGANGQAVSHAREHHHTARWRGSAGRRLVGHRRGQFRHGAAVEPGPAVARYARRHASPRLHLHQPPARRRAAENRRAARASADVGQRAAHRRGAGRAATDHAGFRHAGPQRRVETQCAVEYGSTHADVAGTGAARTPAARAGARSGLRSRPHRDPVRWRARLLRPAAGALTQP